MIQSLGCGQEMLPRYMNVSTGPLECPHEHGVGFLQSE